MTNQEIFDQLKQPLDVKRVSKRQGGGGTSLSYIESHDAISTLNQIFGFDGWSYKLLEFSERITPKGFVYRQTLCLTLHFEGRTVSREDVGIGIAANGNADQIEKGMKEAVSDALKRAARTLGDQFGNSLYEKDAPEHKGQQQARLATNSQLVECEALRLKAVQLGFQISGGKTPKKQEEGAEEKAVLGRIEAYRAYIQEHGDKGQGVPVPPEQPQARFKSLREKLVSSDAFGDFEGAAQEANLLWESDADIAAFEDAATRMLDVPVIAENLTELEWSEFAVQVQAGNLGWPK